MSVWVEICIARRHKASHLVTLHVSVWVEIIFVNSCGGALLSRSTWACELKFMWTFVNGCIGSSRSTWACELKSRKHPPKPMSRRHAPRERVSWNRSYCGGRGTPSVTLHVSVWVEMKLSWHFLHTNSSRSTWACELKSVYTLNMFYRLKSRSTWACELKLDCKYL